MQACGHGEAAAARGAGAPTHKAASWDGPLVLGHAAPTADVEGRQHSALNPSRGGGGGALGRGGALFMSFFPTMRGRIPIFTPAGEEGVGGGGDGEGQWDSVTSAPTGHQAAGEGAGAPQWAKARPGGGQKLRPSLERAPEGASSRQTSTSTTVAKATPVKLPPGGPETPSDHRPASSRASSCESGCREPAEKPSFSAFLLHMAEDCAQQMPALKLACRRLNECVENSAASPPGEEPSGLLKLFEGVALPCSPERYMLRMVKYGETSPCNVIVALIYLDRARRLCPGLALTPSNAQRLLLVAVMTATKFLDDEHYSNKYWAKIGELSLEEMNRLELAFLTMLDMGCQVHRAEYDAFVDAMTARDFVLLAPRAPARAAREQPPRKSNPALSPVSSIYDACLSGGGPRQELFSPLFRTTSLSL